MQAEGVGEVAGDFKTEEDGFDNLEGVYKLKNNYSFEVRNGAGVTEIAGRYGKVILEKLEGAELVDPGNAEKTDYEESILVSFILNKEDALKVAEVLGLELRDLPEGEEGSEKDFLVIVGKDQGESGGDGEEE